jgi:hypothetical protein
MDAERFTKRKDTRRRMKKEAFQLRLEEASIKKEIKKVEANPFAHASSVEMNMNDLARSIPLLDDLEEIEKPKKTKKTQRGDKTAVEGMSLNLFDELEEEQVLFFVWQM